MIFNSSAIDSIRAITALDEEDRKNVCIVIQ
jgi:hypothetical protein